MSTENSSGNLPSIDAAETPQHSNVRSMRRAKAGQSEATKARLRAARAQNQAAAANPEPKVAAAVTVSQPAMSALSMHGVMHMIEDAQSMANAIAGLAKTLQELDSSKIDSEDETLAWYTGTGGFHSGSIQSAIEHLASEISSDMDAIENRLRPLMQEVTHGDE